MYGFVKILLFNFHRLPLYGIYNLIYSKKKKKVREEKLTPKFHLPLPGVQKTGNWDAVNSLTKYSRQYQFLHTCSSHKGLQRCSLQVLYESLAVEFTDGDRAKCNPISAGINHPAPFFGRTICLQQATLVRREVHNGTKKRREGEEEESQIHASRTIRTKQIVLSFSVD